MVNIVMSREAFTAFENYLKLIRTQPQHMGRRLAYVLKASDLHEITEYDLIDALLKTKNTLLYAGKEDHFPKPNQAPLWNQTEFQLLGRMTPYVQDVTAYSGTTFAGHPDQDTVVNGQGANHAREAAMGEYISRFNHDESSKTQNILFLGSNGLLLSGAAADAPDFALYQLNKPPESEAEKTQYKDSKEWLKAQWADRILPGLRLAQSKSDSTHGFIYTLPKLGSNEFAGQYRWIVNEVFQECLQEIIVEHQDELNHLKGIALASDSASDPRSIQDTGIQIRTLAWHATGQDNLGMLSKPSSLFPDYVMDQALLVHSTAADPLSWIGNTRYFGGSQTSEGGVAAVSTVVLRFLGLQKNDEADLDELKLIHNTQTLIEGLQSSRSHLTLNRRVKIDSISEVPPNEGCLPRADGQETAYRPEMIDPTIDPRNDHQVWMNQPWHQRNGAHKGLKLIVTISLIIGLAAGGIAAISPYWALSLWIKLSLNTVNVIGVNIPDYLISGLLGFLGAGVLLSGLGALGTLLNSNISNLISRTLDLVFDIIGGVCFVIKKIAQLIGSLKPMTLIKVLLVMIPGVFAACGLNIARLIIEAAAHWVLIPSVLHAVTISQPVMTAVLFGGLCVMIMTGVMSVKTYWRSDLIEERSHSASLNSSEERSMFEGVAACALQQNNSRKEPASRDSNLNPELTHTEGPSQ
ncbi:MAG: hypothetical protein CMF51_05405 [Legionellales bacterium]|nr:hypothetical protein [Legionellales bacterium]